MLKDQNELHKTVRSFQEATSHMLDAILKIVEKILVTENVWSVYVAYYLNVYSSTSTSYIKDIKRRNTVLKCCL